MTREEIINDLCQFFSVKELVCPHIYEKWREASWQFLDTDYLHCLLVIRRDILKVPMLCNNGKDFTQRGMRCNMCVEVYSRRSVYVSAHILGKAGDFSSTAMNAEQMRNTIKKNHALLPCPIRMEKGVSWLHFDTICQHGVHSKVYEFQA